MTKHAQLIAMTLRYLDECMFPNQQSDIAFISCVEKAKRILSPTPLGYIFSVAAHRQETPFLRRSLSGIRTVDAYLVWTHGSASLFREASVLTGETPEVLVWEGCAHEVWHKTQLTPLRTARDASHLPLNYRELHHALSDIVHVPFRRMRTICESLHDMRTLAKHSKRVAALSGTSPLLAFNIESEATRIGTLSSTIIKHTENPLLVCAFLRSCRKLSRKKNASND